MSTLFQFILNTSFTNGAGLSDCITGVKNQVCVIQLKAHIFCCRNESGKMLNAFNFQSFSASTLTLLHEFLFLADFYPPF